MTLEQKRVAEVFKPPSKGKPNFGSGYFLTDRLVLTAAHVVPLRGRPCEVRPLGEVEWLPATVLWRGHRCDAALLQVEPPTTAGLAGSPTRLGRIDGPTRISARALGFPLAQAGRSGVRDTEEIEGEIVPLSGVKAGLLTVHIRGSVPTVDRSGHSPWEGMSGAALFSNAHLVGVVVVDPDHFGTDRLKAVPIAAALAEPGFHKALAKVGEEFLAEAVDDGVNAPRAGAAAIENFLHHYLGDSGKGVHFGGRDAELANLDSWIRDPLAQPYFLVVGRPGRGKSALLARWWERLQEREYGRGIQTIFVPISIRYDLTRETSVLKAAVAGLAAMHGEEAAAQSSEEWRELLTSYLQRSPAGGSTMLAIVDGLDEASGWSPGPSLFPWQPASGLKVLVSARLTAIRSTAAEWLQELGWDGSTARAMTLDALSAAGIRDVLTKAEPPLKSLAANDVVVAQLLVASEGDPLVLGLFLSHLAALPPEALAHEVADLGEQEPGLRGYMARWWADQERFWGTGLAEQAQAVGSVFNVLACAFGPLPRRELLDLTRRLHALSGDQLDAALRVLDRFVLRDSQDGYAISHPRLAEYRRELLQADDEIGTYDQLFVAWGRETLDALRDQTLKAPDAAGYIVRHYAEHLDRTHAEPDRFLDLGDPTWAAAWEAVADEPNSHLEDVERARRAVSRANEAAVAMMRPAPFIGGEVWCGWVRAQGEAVLELVSGQLASHLVRHGFWSERRALGACARIESPERRADELTVLAPILSLTGTHQLLELLPGLRETWSASQLTAAAVRRLVALDDLDTATRVVQSTDPGDAHALASFALLPVVGAEEQVELVRAIVQDLTSSTAVSELDLLDLLTRSVDRDAATAALGESPERALSGRLSGRFSWWPAGDEFDTIEDGVDRAYALSVLARWLPSATLEDRLEDVLAGLVTRGLPYNVEDAIAHLAPWLRGAWLRRALDVLDRLLEDHPVWRGFAWVHLLDSAEGDERADLLRRAVEELPAMMGHGVPGETAQALAGLARHGAGAAVLTAIGELDGESWEKADFLANVAPYLDAPGVASALSLLRETRAATRNDTMRPLLGRLASFGASEAQDALALASTSSDTDAQDLATGILKHVDAPRLDCAGLLAIEDPLLRFAAIAASARTTRVTGSDLLDVLSSFGDEDDDNAALGLDAFDELQRELPDMELTTDDALAAFERVVRRGLHEHKDQIAMRYFQRLADAAGVATALNFATGVASPDFNHPVAWAVLAVGNRSRDSEDAAATREAAARVTEPVQRAAVKAVLVHLLPQDEQMTAADRLLSDLDPMDTELWGSWITHCVQSLPDSFRGGAVSRLVPDSLLDGDSSFALPDTWARHIRDIVDVLSLDQARRLASTAQRHVHSSERSGLHAAIATRMAALGELEEALEILGACNRDHVAAALRRLADLLPAHELLRPIELGHEVLLLPYWRAERAYAWAGLGRRIPEMDASDVWRLFESWLDRMPSRDEILVDLTLYAPAITMLGGPNAARDLLFRFAVTAMS
jgi:hypothetical protein